MARRKSRRLVIGFKSSNDGYTPSAARATAARRRSPRAAPPRAALLALAERRGSQHGASSRGARALLDVPSQAASRVRPTLLKAHHVPDKPPRSAARRASRLRSGRSVFDHTRRAGHGQVNTVYGGAHLFKADTARKLGAVALGAVESTRPTSPPSRGRSSACRGPRAPGGARRRPRARGRDAGGRRRRAEPPGAARLADAVHARVLDKLRREPVEDLASISRTVMACAPGTRRTRTPPPRPARSPSAWPRAACASVPRDQDRRSAMGAPRGACGTLDVFFSALVAASGGAPRPPSR